MAKAEGHQTGTISSGEANSASEAAARRRIESAIRRARLVLLWESVWPVVAPILVLAGLFAIVSWFGLWRVVSDPVRLVILAAFGLAAIGLALRAFR
ncbi:MAG: DUF4175 family protein, partial [Rhizobiales bacterium]|nr:DUF4175 family protein [Hyphomicrobiales bacterium]